MIEIMTYKLMYSLCKPISTFLVLILYKIYKEFATVFGVLVSFSSLSRAATRHPVSSRRTDFTFWELM